MAFGRGKVTMGSTAPAEDQPYDGTQWEYATVSAQPAGGKLSERLNEHGLLGWEAVGMVPLGLGGTVSVQVLMKRPLRARA